MPRAGRTSPLTRSRPASRARLLRRATYPASLAGWAALYTGSEDNETMDTSAQTATVTVTPQQALWLELMQFYIREAWLLDERKFTEWLDLFTEDVLYFMPRRKNVPHRELHREVTPLGDLALFE